MKLFYGIILALMIFVSACAQQPAAEPEAQPSEPEAAPAPPEPEPEVAPAPNDIRYAGADGFDTDKLTISVGSSVTFFNDDSKTMVVIVFKDGRNFATPRIVPGQQAEVEFTELGEYDFWWNLAYTPYGGKITVE
jgi:plastocyanin